MTSFKEILDSIQNQACSCDVMMGYQCPVHNDLSNLEKLYNQKFHPGKLLIGPSPGSEESSTESLKIDYEGMADSYFLNPETIPEMIKEIRRGVTIYGNYMDWNQARFVIQDELHELWMEIRNHPRDVDKVRTEALQVAATAMRLVEEIDTGNLK